MSDPKTACAVCGGDHVVAPGESCPEMRAAAAQGAQPPGVPMRVYSEYLAAREALKKDAPANAARALTALLDYLAEERGIPAESTFMAKLQKLCDQDVISPRMSTALFERAVGRPPEQAWALMSIVEHALYRLYLKPHRG